MQNEALLNQFLKEKSRDPFVVKYDKKNNFFEIHSR